MSKIQITFSQKYRNTKKGNSEIQKKWCRPFYEVGEEQEMSDREAGQVFGAKVLIMPKIIMMIMPWIMMMMVMMMMPRMMMRMPRMMCHVLFL